MAMTQAIPMTIRRNSCATFHLGASNTKDKARSLSDIEAIFMSKFYGFGQDGLTRKDGRMALSMFETSCPPFASSNAASGFQSRKGAEAMTKVNTPTTSTADKIARQQAIENALSTALFHIRQPSTSTALFAATGRASRALTMLKQACADAQIGGAA
jgi:hypothetical protein